MAGRGAGCWESRLSGSVRGWVTTQIMGEILWHRRQIRRQTEKTNFILTSGEFPAYSNSLVKIRRTEIAVRIKMPWSRERPRRPAHDTGKAVVLWEETGMCTTGAAGVGVQAREERFAEITSGERPARPRI